MIDDCFENSDKIVQTEAILKTWVNATNHRYFFDDSNDFSDRSRFYGRLLCFLYHIDNEPDFLHLIAISTVKVRRLYY